MVETEKYSSELLEACLAFCSSSLLAGHMLRSSEEKKKAEIRSLIMSVTLEVDLTMP